MSNCAKDSFTSSNLVNILHDRHGYRNWEALAKELHVSFEVRRRLKHKTAQTQDDHTALKEVLEHWLAGNSRSWTELVNAIDRTGDKTVAQTLKRNYGIAANSSSPQSSSATIHQAASPITSSTIQSRALKSFLKFQEHLQPLLRISINEFSSKLFSRDLLPDEIYDKLYEGTPTSESERAGYLVYSIYRQVSGLEGEGKASQAKELLKKFGEAVYGNDCALRYTGTQILSCRTSTELLSNQDSIKNSIQSSLMSIAATLMSRDLISEEDYNSITDPEYEHIKKFTDEVFKSLREAIKQDYKVYHSLVKVIKDMGPPISTAAARVIDSEFY